MARGTCSSPTRSTTAWLSSRLGGTQQTLPFSGLSDPQGVAVDLAGDVSVADTGNSRVLELSPSLTSGSFVPLAGLRRGRVLDRVASVTPSGCLRGRLQRSRPSCFCTRRPDSFWKARPSALGTWDRGRARCRVPADAANGTTYVVRTRVPTKGVMAQAYRPRDIHGASTQPAGLLGQTRSAAPKLIGEKSKCPGSDQAECEKVVHVHVHLRGKNEQKPSGDRDHQTSRGIAG